MRYLSPENKLQVVKFIATAITSTGVTYVAKDILKNNITPPETKWQSAKLFVGSLVIFGMIGAASDDFVEKRVDDYAERLNSLKSTFGKGGTDGANQSAE